MIRHDTVLFVSFDFKITQKVGKEKGENVKPNQTQKTTPTMDTITSGNNRLFAYVLRSVEKR